MCCQLRFLQGCDVDKNGRVGQLHDVQKKENKDAQSNDHVFVLCANYEAQI